MGFETQKAQLTLQFSPLKTEDNTTFLKGLLEKRNELTHVKHLEWCLALTSSVSVLFMKTTTALLRALLKSQHGVGATRNC